MTMTKEERDYLKKDILERSTFKDVIKEAFKEMVKEEVTNFGWFSIKTIGVLAGGGLLYFILTQNGWHK